MDKGKFSQPRPYRDEERQIEEAFRQVTAPKKEKQAQEPAQETFSGISQDTIPLEIPPAQPEPVPEAAAPVPAASPPEPKASFSIKKFLFEEELDFEDLPEEPDEDLTEEPESVLDRVYNFCMSNRKWILPGLCALALVMLIAVIAVFAAGSSGTDKDTLQGNVFVAGVNLNGMTKKQAVSAVKQATNTAYAQNSMVVDLAGTKLELTARDTGAKLDTEAVVEAAFSLAASPESQYIALLPYLTLDTAFIRQELETRETK